MRQHDVGALMKRFGIRSVVYVPADDLHSTDTFHAWPIDGGGLDTVCGRGPTPEAAIHDCMARLGREAA